MAGGPLMDSSRLRMCTQAPVAGFVPQAWSASLWKGGVRGCARCPHMTPARIWLLYLPAEVDLLVWGLATYTRRRVLPCHLAAAPPQQCWPGNCNHQQKAVLRNEAACWHCVVRGSGTAGQCGAVRGSAGLGGGSAGRCRAQAFMPWMTTVLRGHCHTRALLE